jgi:2-hydroxychromene-2-carboxylate isomerase
MANDPVIEYYFSFISLWSYIGSQRLQLLAKKNNTKIVYKPTDLMHLFSISSGLPVKQRSVQHQAYRLIEMERWCRIRKILIVQHRKCYPANPSLAHRVLLAAIEEAGHESEEVQEFARKGLETVWANEGDIAEPATIVKLADAAGLEGARLLRKAETERGLADRETALTEKARLRQVFGAPFYFYRNEPFGGQDRLEMLEDVIQRDSDVEIGHK